MGNLPERPEPAAVRAAVNEIHAGRGRADDDRRELLGTEPLEVLEFLRRRPATRPEDIAAEGRAALVLVAELRWQLLEHEQAQLLRLDDLPTDARPTNAAVGALLGRVASTVGARPQHRPATSGLGHRAQHPRAPRGRP